LGVAFDLAPSTTCTTECPLLQCACALSLVCIPFRVHLCVVAMLTHSRSHLPAAAVGAARRKAATTTSSRRQSTQGRTPTRIPHCTQTNGTLTTSAFAPIPFAVARLPSSSFLPPHAASRSKLTHPTNTASAAPNSSAHLHATKRVWHSGTRALHSGDTAPRTPSQQQQQREEQRDQSSDRGSSSSSSHTTASFHPFRWLANLARNAFNWYASKLDAHPVKTQGLTSGFLFFIGDITAQRYEHRLDKSKGIDTSDRPYLALTRLAACTSFGLFVLGPFGHHWYARLDVVTNRLYAPRSLKNVALKVLLDTAIFNPIFLVVFFTSVSLLEGLTVHDIGRKLYRDFVPSYAVDCSVWPPIQTINFRFVPVKFQLLVVNLGCYFDDVVS
jgi:protein Mpv17